MRLLSQISRKYGDTEYRKFWVVLANKLIKKLGWKKGDALKAEIKGNKLVIEKENEKE